MTTINRVEEPKSESLQSTETYRAPRLVRLGTAVELVQGGLGLYGDNPNAPYQGRHG